MSDQSRDVVLSVRVSDEDAAELRLWAKRTGRTISQIVREGIRYPLERQRALWLEEHHGDPGAWEVIPGSGQLISPRKLDSMFSVRVTSEQLRDMLPAAEAAGLPLSAFMRVAGLRLAAAMAEGGTARCWHLSLGPVTAAECHECGPLPVTYLITQAAS